jgi:hypothetical protein
MFREKVKSDKTQENDRCASARLPGVRTYAVNARRNSNFKHSTRSRRKSKRDDTISIAAVTTRRSDFALLCLPVCWMVHYLPLSAPLLLILLIPVCPLLLLLILLLLIWMRHLLVMPLILLMLRFFARLRRFPFPLLIFVAVVHCQIKFPVRSLSPSSLQLIQLSQWKHGCRGAPLIKVTAEGHRIG